MIHGTYRACHEDMFYGRVETRYAISESLLPGCVHVTNLGTQHETDLPSYTIQSSIDREWIIKEVTT